MTASSASFGRRPAVKSVRAFACPGCGGPIELRAPGITVTAVCRQCSTVIDAANPDLRVIQAARKAAFEPGIAIGTRGELYGVMWEVIGYTRKSVQNTVYGWDEYLLFNPWEGFRFLSQWNGHWTFFKRLNRDIPGIGQRDHVEMDGKGYDVFNKDYVQVDAVQGEFYWRVKQGDTSRGADYIRPPFMLSCEETDDERTISLGTYVPAPLMRKAFPEARLPYSEGVGACQPSPSGNKVRGVVNLAILAAAAAVVIHVGSAIVMPSQKVVDIAGETIKVKPAASPSLPTSGPMWGSEITTPSQTEGQEIATESFTLPHTGNIRIDTETRLDNGWADFDLVLVNDVTNATYPMRQSTSYYHGYEDGESWREGHNGAQAWLSGVPAGRYHLLIDADSDVLGKDGTLPFSLTLRRQVKEIWNLLIALLLIALYPAYAVYRRWSFESARWSNSDYSSGSLFGSGDA